MWSQCAVRWPRRTENSSGRSGEANFFNGSRRIFESTRLNWRDFCSLVSVHEASFTGENVEITSPKAFTSGAILIIAGCGVLLVAPVLASLLAVTIIKLGVLTVLIPLLTIAVTAYFLPFGLGNPV